MQRRNVFLLNIVILCLVYSLFLLFDDSVLVSLGKEDGFFQMLTAVFFLIASVFFFFEYLKNKEVNDFIIYKTRKNILLLLLSIVFFVGFGEEISWGQRIFNLNTPEALERINVQNEINIHNIAIFHGKTADGKPKGFFAKFLTIDRLFSIFWFVFCLVIPILVKTNKKIGAFIRKINIPLIPIWLGAFFILNYILSKILEKIVALQCTHSLVEIKEFNFAFLFAVVSMYLYCTRSANPAKHPQG